MNQDGEKLSLGQRLSKTFLKPPKPGSRPTSSSSEPHTLEELEELVRFADDKERAIGLIAAPLAAAISLLVIRVLISNDPPALLKSGLANSAHVSVSLYNELQIVLLVLAVVMLVTAWLRKRLYLGIVMALFGLAIFNLHYWGFGVPFIMGAAWYMIRAFRLQRELKEITGSGRPGTSRPALPSRPSSNKRYTPPGWRGRSN